MASRKLPLLLVPLLLLGLMAVALVLVVQTGAFDDPGGSNDDPALVDGDLNGAEAERTKKRGNGHSQRRGAISGDVRSLDTRDAAPGRDVVLILPGGEVRELSTGSDGSFSFGDVPPGGPYELRVEGSDHAPVLRPGLWLTPSQRLDVGTLWLADGVRVGVEVRAFDGRPLADAVVRAFATGSSAPPFDTPRDPPPVAAARSGPDGWAWFEGLPPGTWTFTAERSGYARRGLIGATVREGVDEETFRMALERGYRLEGRVLDARGEPVRGATVLAIRRTLVSDRTTAALAQRTVTDRDGRYVFAGLPAADVVLWSGWPRSRLAVLAAVRVPGVEEVDLTLLRGGKVVGRITSREGGDPIEGAKVDVNILVLGAFALRFQALTNDLGAYVVKLPMPGRVDWVSVGAKGYVTQQVPLGDSGEIVVPTGATVTLDADLAPGGVITGRVTGPGGPIEGVEVGATNPNWYFTTTTDRQGRYTLVGLPDERFLMMATKFGYVMPNLPQDPDGSLTSGTAPSELVVELGAGVDATVDLRLEPGASLRGRVERADGTAAAGALVEIPGSGLGSHAGDDGTFVLGPVTPGEYALSATLDGYGRHTSRASIPRTGEPPDVTLRIPPGARVTGHLTSKSGTALDGAYVQIVPWDDSFGHPVNDEWSWLESVRLPVAADGTFVHPLLQSSGSFFVRAGALGHRRASSGRVGVVAGREEYYVELSLEDGETFSGQVVDFDGAPVPRAFVSAVLVPEGTAPEGVDYPGAWGPPISAVADEHGVFRIDGLDQGPHVFRAWADGYIAHAQTLAVPEDSGARFEIIAWMSITGRVLFPDGQPVSAALIEASGGENGDYVQTRTDDDGRFVVTGLSRGDYTLTVGIAPGGGQNVLRKQVSGIAAGTIDVEIEAERGLGIAGVVTDADGTPVVAAQIGVNDDFRTSTSADGSFQLLGLSAGVYTIQVRSEAMHWVGDALRKGVRAGTEDLAIQLPRAALLEGVLRDEDGRPLASRALHFEPTSTPESSVFKPYPRDAQTDGAGNFSVYAAPGQRFVAWLQQDASLTLPKDTIVETGRHNELRATRGATITGRVLGPGGVAAQGVQVYAQGGGVTRITNSGNDGAFTLSGLHAGERYTVWINSDKWALDENQNHEAPATGALLSVEPTRSLGGQIVDASGSPVGSIAMHIEQDSSGTTWMFWTNDEGRFSLDGLRGGACEIAVDHPRTGERVTIGTLEPGTTDARLTLPD